MENTPKKAGEKLPRKAKKKMKKDENKGAPVIVERQNFSERPHGRKHDSPLGGRNPKAEG